MKIVLTGASGLIGRELGKALVARGHQVIVLSRHPDLSYLHCPFPHRSFYWDALKGKLPENLWQGVDGLIHLAGENIAANRWTKSFKERLYKTRVEGSKSLVQSIRDKAPHLQFFLSTSAAGYYPFSMEKSWTEEDAPGTSFLSKICSDWEKACLLLPKTTRCLIFRLGIIFSEKGGALQKMAVPTKDSFGLCIGSGKQYLNWIDVDDVITAYIWALESRAEGVFNLAAPKAVSNEELTKGIAACFQKKLRAKIPSPLIKLAVGEMGSMLLESQKMNMEKLLKTGFSFRYTELKDSLQKNLSFLKNSEEFFWHEQWVPEKREKLFSFFKNAQNLEKITPSKLNFKVLSQSSPEIKKGTEIQYKLQFYGLKFYYSVVIESWDPDKSFSDKQKKGPFRYWHHEHQFQDLGEGTLIRDRLYCSFPFHALSSLLVKKIVRKSLEELFFYRGKTLYEKAKESKLH